MSQTCYRHPAHSAGVTCQRCDKPICPSCMVTASVGFHCPECSGIKREKNVPKISKRRVPRNVPSTYGPNFLAQSFTPVTLAVILINLIFYIFSVINWGGVDPPSGEVGTIEINFGLIESYVKDGDWWRIFTNGFIHGGFFHIISNMLIFWFVGRQLESHLGPVKFSLLYIASIVGGSFAILWFTSTSIVGNVITINVTVGASGGVYGLMGAFLVLSKFHTGRFVNSIISIILAVNIGFNLLSIVSNRGGISYEGHLGGLVTGTVVALSYTYLRSYISRSLTKRFVQVITYSLPIIIIAMLFVGGLLIAQ